MTVNVGRANASSAVTADLTLPNGQDLADALEEIKLQTVTPKKSIKHLASTESSASSSKSFFTFRRKSKDTSNEKSFSNKMMRKFVSNGNSSSNSKAPVSLRRSKKKKSEQSSSSVSRSSSEPALNQPQEAFVREAPSSAKHSTSNSGSGKKKKSGVFKRKTRNSVLPSSSSSISLAPSTTSLQSSSNITNMVREPVFHVDVRTQNTRLVTPRQRQEIYALNRVMTRLENEKFKKFCQERGYKGDLQANDKDVVEYDIFM